MPVEEKVDGKVAADGAKSGEEGKQKEVPFNEHPRWKEVYGELQEWKKLGSSPSEINAKLAEGNELKAAFEEAAKQVAADAEKKGGSDEEVAKVYKQARAELEKIFPEIKHLTDLKAKSDAHDARLERAAIAETRAVLKSAELETDDKSLRTMCDMLADIIRNDEELDAEYQTSPRTAVRGAFEKFTAKFKTAAAREAAASKQKERETTRGLPKAHGAGGGEGGGEKPAPEAKSIKEAEQRAIARLKGMSAE